jgi:hypothetical protein
VVDGWSWDSTVKQYRDQASVRENELKRHASILNGEKMRHPEKYDFLKSGYERGLEANARLSMGTSAMGEYSRLEQIKSAAERASNPIPGDMDRDYAEDTWQRDRRNNYNPILQKYQDEIDERPGEQQHQQHPQYDGQQYEEPQQQRQQFQPQPPKYAPTPPRNNGMHQLNIKEFKQLNSNKERASRTAEWMPGRPKGGRSLVAKESPILGDMVDSDVIQANEKTREEFAEKDKEKFVRIFQVYPNIGQEIRATRQEVEKRNASITTALNRRMVREGGYDPITLRDRRTGDPVGPLPDNNASFTVKNQHSLASSYAAKSRTGAHVAFALGCDRWGDPDGGMERERLENLAQIDHVSEIMMNEERIEAGQHDLEDRYVHPTKVQMLMDDRYADQWEEEGGKADNLLSWENEQFDDNINGGVGGAGVTRGQVDYEPDLRAHELLHCDTMSTWVPRINAAHDDKDDRMAFNKRQQDMYNHNYLHDGQGYSTGAGVVDAAGGKPSKGIRLWPEKRKEISSGTPR